jgi:hypothetical protein
MEDAATARRHVSLSGEGIVRIAGVGRWWSAAGLTVVAGVIILPAAAAHAGTAPTNLDLLAQVTGGHSTTVANWRMDDGADGVMHDGSTYGNDGTLQNVGTGLGAYTFTTVGKPSRVVVPNSASLNPGTHTFTVSMHVWVVAKPKSGTDYDLIRKGQGDAAADWKIEIMDTGRARCYTKGSEGKGNIYSSRALSTGAWHTVVCTYSPSAVKISVDGSSKTEKRTIGAISNNNALSIAAKYGPPDDGGDQFVGAMNNVVITSA